MAVVDVVVAVEKETGRATIVQLDATARDYLLRVRKTQTAW